MLIALAVVLVCALGAIQLASDAIFARAGEPPSLPAHLPARLGIATYRAAGKISQAPFIDAMLARAELNRGDLAAAARYTRRLPDSARRDDLFGEIAQARGQDRLAQQYFVRAGDIEAIDTAVHALTDRDPARAYALEDGLRARLQQSATHPDLLAEAYWTLGNLAWRQSKRALAMQKYRQAIDLSPLSEKFLLSAGFAEYELHDDAAAQRYFMRVLSVNPASANAYAGAGMLALRAGDRTRAQQYAQRARAGDPRAPALLTLEMQLRK
ncbi:MAG TPA: hypothetical protein VFN37_04775 [Candidatus Baltobacteraceae bacterium]|nr:hypothetical protein [Candidatus Baltobacteraceae bacterium]